jgi:hypothetical protein
VEDEPVKALALLALLLPGVAWADPISIGIALSSAAAAAGAFITAYAVQIAVVAYSVYGASNARRKGRIAAARQRAEYNANLQDRSITALTANPPWRVVYGRCITGGDIVAIFTTDKTGTRTNGTSFTKPDALKHLVIVVAAHQVQAINEIYIEGVALGALDGNGWVTTGDFYKTSETDSRTVTVPASSYLDVSPAVSAILNSYTESGVGVDRETTPVSGITLSIGNTRISNANAFDVQVAYTIVQGIPRVRVSKHLGTDSQTVDTYLNGVAPSQWTANHRLRGMAYVVVTLDLEEPRFQGGPPGMTFDVSGKLIYDTRSATTAYSTNPALIVRDFLTAPWGYACSSAEVDATLCNAAANACDVAISLDVGGVVTTGQPTYTCNGAFSTAESREAVLDDLCESMAGFATYGATWGIVSGSWTASVMTLTDDDLDGQIEIVQAGAGLDTIFNGIRGQYIAAGKSSPSDFDSYQNATFLAADGEALWTDIALPYTDNKARARNLARIFVERNRDGLVIRYPAKLKAWPLQIGDRVTVTSAEYGFSAKTFRVTDWQFGASTAVQLTLQEDAAVVYDLADAATADPTPNTALPNPWAVAAIAGLTANSGTSYLVRASDGAISSRVWVSWTAVSDAYVTSGGYVHVRWLVDTSDEWSYGRVSGDSLGMYIDNVRDGTPMVIEAWAQNGIGAISSRSIIAHTVLGKAQAPQNVTGLGATQVTGGVKLYWTPATDADYAQTELRTGASWAAGTRIFKGRASEFVWLSPAQGSYTLRAKHYDETGNESATEDTISVMVDSGILVDWTNSDNLIYNSAFEHGLNGWSVAAANGFTPTTGTNYVSPGGTPIWRLLPTDAPWTSAIYMEQAASATNATWYYERGSEKISVKPSTRYILSGYLQPRRCQASIFVRGYTATGAATSPAMDGVGGGSTTLAEQSDGTTLDKYVRVSSAFTTSSNCAYVVVFVRKYDTSSSTSSYLFATRFMLEEATATSVVSDWTPGPDAPNGSIDTGQLVANATTDIYQDSYDFAGAGSSGTSTSVRTFTYTPSVDCTVEASAAISASNVLGDSGHYIWWQVEPASGGTIYLFGSNNNDTVRHDFAWSTSFTASANVQLTFRLVTSASSGQQIYKWKSLMRATFVKR